MGIKLSAQSLRKRLGSLLPNLDNPAVTCVLNTVCAMALLGAAAWASYSFFKEPEPPPPPIVVIVEQPKPAPVPTPRPRPRCHFLAFSWRC